MFTRELTVGPGASDHWAMDQRGFTLIELLVVVLIIGILAAIALPVFLGQKEKSQDASAKSDARNAVSQIESCFTTTYAGCDTYSGRPANVAVTIDTPKSAYTVVATSKAANSGRTFTIKLETNGTRTRSCTPDGGGCDGTSW